MKNLIAFALLFVIVVAVVKCVHAVDEAGDALVKCAPGIETVHTKDGRDVSAIACTGEQK